jgi:GNAT superfamily N-acetyltransferase
VTAVRPAGPDDLDRCAELLAEALGQTLGSRGAALLSTVGAGAAGSRRGPPPDPGQTPAQVVARWAADGRLVVGSFEGADVGLGAASVPPGGAAVGRIECCYVEPVAREVGVGEAIVEDLTAWLAAQGCIGADAVALPGDRSTKQLLETAGFKARLLVLHRPLGPGATTEGEGAEL